MRWQPGACQPPGTRDQKGALQTLSKPVHDELAHLPPDSRVLSIALCCVSARIATRRPRNWPAICACWVAWSRIHPQKVKRSSGTPGRPRPQPCTRCRRSGRSTHSGRAEGLSRRRGRRSRDAPAITSIGVMPLENAGEIRDGAYRRTASPPHCAASWRSSPPSVRRPRARRPATSGSACRQGRPAVRCAWPQS